MHRKIIIKAKDLDKEICSFLTQVRADIPVDWNSNALALVRDTVKLTTKWELPLRSMNVSFLGKCFYVHRPPHQFLGTPPIARIS